VVKKTMTIFKAVLPRDAMHKRGLCCHAVSVCLSVRLSVRLSVTFMDHVKTNKHIFEIFTPSGSDTTLVFPYQRGCRYSDGNLPNGGVECKGGMKNSAFRPLHAARGLASTELSFHSCNALRDCHRGVPRANKK